MAQNKVDPVHYHYNKSSGKIELWLFNDSSFYKESAEARVAKYDFGRSSEENDKKMKLMIGLYREPYRDGWKYTLFAKIHPQFAETVLDYINFGWSKDKESGELIENTYLRHNRKALGIHYLFERYVRAFKRCQKLSSDKESYKEDFDDYKYQPYFPTPQSYDGYVRTRRKLK